MESNNMHTYYRSEHHDGSVGIATRYGLDGLRIESQWGGETIRTRPDQPWDPPILPI